MEVLNSNFMAGNVPTPIKYIEEIGIVVAAKDLTPTMMSHDFLKFSGIVPKDWELVQQPVLSPNFAQLIFQNGVNIIAQPRSIIITESIGKKSISHLQAPLVSGKYVEKLPHAEYQGYNFTHKILVPFPGRPDAVHKYIAGTILAQGPWQNIGQAFLQAETNLLYQLEGRQLSINVSEARLQQPQQNPIIALMFAGSFNYSLTIGDRSRLEKLFEAIAYWHRDLKQFRQIVEQDFLSTVDLGRYSQEETVFPVGAM